MHRRTAGRSLLVAAAAAVWLAAGPGAARAAPPGEEALVVQAGAAVAVGPGPVRQVICDDPSVVRLVETPAGPALRGLAPGKTLCSLVDAASVRRYYRVTVVAAPRPGDPAPASPNP